MTAPRYECWIVSGSRELEDDTWVRVRLDQLAKRHGHPRVLIHGAARGADLLAKAWAESRGHANIEVRGRPADWDQFKGGAGPKRNREMAVEAAQFASAILISFPIVGLPNKGTLNMIGEAVAAGILFVGMPYRARAGL